ncbi:MAG: hypothetical protein R2883_08315 [Caldisericia bacterium]
MIMRGNITAPIAFTGGVALNNAMRIFLGKELKERLNIPVDPRVTGALGAALISAKQMGTKIMPGELNTDITCHKECEEMNIDDCCDGNNTKKDECCSSDSKPIKDVCCESSDNTNPCCEWKPASSCCESEEQKSPCCGEPAPSTCCSETTPSPFRHAVILKQPHHLAVERKTKIFMLRKW